MHDAGAVLGRLRTRMRKRGAVVLCCSVVLGALATIGTMGDGRSSDKAAVALLFCVVAAVYGVWRVIFIPRWLAHPEEIDRIDRFTPGNRDAMQIVMVDGKTHQLSARVAERDTVAAALQQRCNEIRLRARVVDR